MKAIFIGRFQPFHLGHLHVIKTYAKRYDLVIIIGSSNIQNTKENPFTAEERMLMLQTVFSSNNLTAALRLLGDVPDDIVWRKNLDSGAAYDVVLTGNLHTASLFKDKKVIILERYQGISSTAIRNNIKNSLPWDHLVPQEIIPFIKACSHQ
ncbi:adenylyltransferase/cytidyltransferase family protein [Candidatus Woesearchaeota archaeon]|nr:adenylyltransferase/cytidyltransferase family protein [Candidatus Woesearchaeota archaeon]HIH38272.1 adenylyltransferase/cytidyltransferase family protein [Candidatus Woesearchaeota archaeon]HIH49154.1 adenylyltransferase/cytidyltransferase family protein [Candidatus Woesearchaeota archaeon]HIJ04428.1 adenylyltransferase/cytidyltransferase family protein [Candidatus Woesearchaeota archaeon]